MKTFAAVVLFFLSLNSFAESQNPKPPTGLCANPTRPCSARQIEILENFEKSNSAPATPTAHALYQGGCYMISGTYSADHEHFGYIYVRDQGNGELGFHGQFGFFYPQNPYAVLTPAEADSRFPGPSKNTVMTRATDWLVEIDTVHNWRYFARQLENGNLGLIGLWGINDAIICEMTENK
jgi:hypothetical protein